MGGVVWLSNVENSEQVGIPLSRISLIEQKSMREGSVVAIFLENGAEIRVIETLETVRSRLADAMGGAPLQTKPENC